MVADNGQHQIGSGGNGGAVVIDGGSDGTHTFCGSIFTNNTGGAAALGGALFRTPDNAKQTTAIDRCTFDGNHGESGGAAYFHNSDLTITRDHVLEQHREQGLGRAAGRRHDVRRCSNETFSGNSALAGLGGAIVAVRRRRHDRFTTFADNHADGGDPYFGAAIAGNPTLTLTSDIFANNTARNTGAPMQCQVPVRATATSSGRAPTSSVAHDTPCTPTTTFADPLLGALGSNGGPTATLVPARAARRSARA